MTKRPAVLDIDQLMVRPKAPEAVTSPPPPPASDKPTKAETFRTSIYFHRPVHDALRNIAFAERKTISDLINEGLDLVLKSRNYASLDELRKSTKAS